MKSLVSNKVFQLFLSYVVIYEKIFVGGRLLTTDIRAGACPRVLGR